MQTKETNIGHFLPTDYQPPYGTSLYPDSFKYLEGSPDIAGDAATKADGYWQASTTDKDGNTVIYTLTRPATKTENCVVWKNDQEVLPQDVNTKEYRPLPLGLTYDWVLGEEAAARLANAQPQWSGQSLDAVLRRIEHNVSTYSRTEVNLKNFGTLTDFQNWLDKELSATTVKAEAFEIRPFPRRNMNKPWRSKHIKVQTLVRHWHPEVECHLAAEPDANGVQNLLTSIYLDTDLDSEKFYNQGDCSHSLVSPLVSILHDGAELTRYEAQYVVEIDELEKHGVIYWAKDIASGKADHQITLPPLNENGWHKPWWGIAFPEIGLAMAFPRIGTNLLLNTESDGAEMNVRAEETMHRTQINYLVDGFERTWGKWIDPDSNMTQAELDLGVARAEALVAGLEHGPELTKKLLSQWWATLNAQTKPAIINKGKGIFLVIQDDKVLVINSLDWPLGHYAFRNEQLTFLPEGAPDNCDTNGIWAKYDPMNETGDGVIEAINAYHQERFAQFDPFNADSAPTDAYVDEWLDTFPADVNFVFFGHIANQYASVTQTKGWYFAPYRIIESARLLEMLNAWWDRHIDNDDHVIPSADFAAEVLETARSVTPPSLP